MVVARRQTKYEMRLNMALESGYSTMITLMAIGVVLRRAQRRKRLYAERGGRLPGVHVAGALQQEDTEPHARAQTLVVETGKRRTLPNV